MGGAVRPCNGAVIENGHVTRYRMPKNLLASMQVLEYDRSFLASRILFDKFNGNIIISGAFGLFRKSLVIAAGGYDDDTMGEDMELVVKLHVFCRETGTPYRITLRAGCHLLDAGAGEVGGSLQTAAPVAYRPLPEHDEAQEHTRQP